MYNITGYFSSKLALLKQSMTLEQTLQSGDETAG
jgi:hypothetical protein